MNFNGKDLAIYGCGRNQVYVAQLTNFSNYENINVYAISYMSMWTKMLKATN